MQYGKLQRHLSLLTLWDQLQYEFDDHLCSGPRIQIRITAESCLDLFCQLKDISNGTFAIRFGQTCNN